MTHTGPGQGMLSQPQVTPQLRTQQGFSVHKSQYLGCQVHADPSMSDCKFLPGSFYGPKSDLPLPPNPSLQQPREERSTGEQHLNQESRLQRLQGLV